MYTLAMSRHSPRNLAEQAAVGLMQNAVDPLKATSMASQICANLWCIARTWRRLGQMPTQLEYCDEWKVNERTAQRHWAEIKRAFPGLPVPERQAVEHVTRHVVLHTADSDDQSAALAIDPLEGLAAVAYPPPTTDPVRGAESSLWQRGALVEFDRLTAVVVGLPGDPDVPPDHVGLWFGHPPAAVGIAAGGSGGERPDVWTVPQHLCSPAARPIFRTAA
jgi:hypothetical protein